METKEVKAYYESAVGGSDNSYEFNRWEKNSEKRSSYKSTARALEKNVLDLLPLEGNVFELGPGPGTWTKLLLKKSPQLHFDLVDISEEMLKQAKESLLPISKNIRFINSDILEFTPEDRYDFFFSSRIIEYVPDKERAIKIISESLKSGSFGYIVTKTPHPNRFWGKRREASIHTGQISPLKLKNLLQVQGCDVLKIVNVTSVFPGMRSGFLDTVLTKISEYVPFVLAEYFSESYAVIFRKK